VKEYLPSLLNRDKWLKKLEPLKEGDVVSEKDPLNSRNSWPMGVVVKVFVGDGRKLADVKFATGILHRPVTRSWMSKMKKSA